MFNFMAFISSINAVFLSFYPKNVLFFVDVVILRYKNQNFFIDVFCVYDILKYIKICPKLIPKKKGYDKKWQNCVIIL